MEKARNLTEGAVLLAIFAVLLLMTIYVPFIGIISVWFLAAPFIYFASKNHWKSILVFLIVAVFLALLFGTISAVPITLLLGATGVSIGYLVQKNNSRITNLLLSSMVFLIGIIIYYAGAVVLFDFNFLTETKTTLEASFEKSFQILESVGSEKEVERLKSQLELMLEMVGTLLPSLLVMSSFIFVFIIQLINFPILKRFGLKPLHWKSFRELTLPTSIVWYYLITTILSLFLNPESGSYIYLALWNLAYILQVLLVIQGLSFVYFVSHLKGWSKAIPIIITVLAFITPLGLYIIRILGIIDLGFDLRKRIVKK